MLGLSKQNIIGELIMGNHSDDVLFQEIQMDNVLKPI